MGLAILSISWTFVLQFIRNLYKENSRAAMADLLKMLVAWLPHVKQSNKESSLWKIRTSCGLVTQRVPKPF